MNCQACGSESSYAKRVIFDGGSTREECDRCAGFNTVAPVHDAYVPVGGMFFEHLSHPDYPESYGGTFCPDKATKAHYLKKYGLSEAGDRKGGTNHFDPVAARYAQESLRNPRPSPPRRN